MLEAQAGERQRSAVRAEVEAILGRYPVIDDKEKARLVRFFAREASSLDEALLASSGTSCAGYHAFKRDHRPSTRARRREMMILFGLALLVALFVAICWDLGV